MAKKKEEKVEERVDSKTPPVTNKLIERKIEVDELLQLQKEGRLVEFDPATAMGKIWEKPRKIVWPGGNTEIKQIV